jgi:flagellar FliL protein
MAQDSKAQDNKAEGAEPPKSKKKLIIIIAAVVLVLAIGGGAAWFMLAKKAPPAHGKKADAEHAQAAEGEGHGDAAEAEHEEEGGGGHGAGGPTFVTLDAFTVNLQPDPDEKYLQLEMSLQVSKPEDGDLFKAHMPALRSRILLLLSGKTAKEISTTEGKQKLTEEILVEVRKPFKEKGKPQKVSAVFFTSFVIQ